MSAGPGDTLQIQSDAQEAPPPPRLLVSFTELKGKLRPGTRRPPQVPYSVRGRARIWTKVSSLPDPALPPHRAPPPPSGTGAGGRRRRRGGKGLTNPSTWGKCVCGREGVLHSQPPPRTSGLRGGGDAEPRGLWGGGAIPVTAEAVRFGAHRGQGAERPAPSSCWPRYQLATTAGPTGTQNRAL